MSVAVVLLILGIVTMFVRPRRVPLWAGPFAFASLGAATTAIAWQAAGDAFDAFATRCCSSCSPCHWRCCSTGSASSPRWQRSSRATTDRTTRR